MADLPNIQPDARNDTLLAAPDRMVKVRDVFGLDSDMEVPAFSEADERVPDLDPAYVFDHETTVAIVAANQYGAWRAAAHAVPVVAPGSTWAAAVLVLMCGGAANYLTEMTWVPTALSCQP